MNKRSERFAEFSRMFLLVIVSVIAFVAYWRSVTRMPDSFPPGPKFPLPVVGDAYMLGGNVIEGFSKLGQQYGNIYGLYMGPQRTVIINDYDLANVSYNFVDLKMFV